MTSKEKIVSKITIDYNRITKIEAHRIPNANYEYVVWDYAEKLIIDRQSETMEYIRKIGENCDVAYKYHIGDGIEKLLDSIDISVFDEIEGNPLDAFDDPMETKRKKFLVKVF